MVLSKRMSTEPAGVEAEEPVSPSRAVLAAMSPAEAAAVGDAGGEGGRRALVGQVPWGRTCPCK